MQVISIPECCLLLLVGASGCGKSTFAHQHFSPSEILSSDAFRAIISDDELNQEASADAFQLIREAAAMRLRRRLLTVIDATNLEAEHRREMVSLARDCYANAVAIVFDVPEAICHLRNDSRHRPRPRGVIHRQVRRVGEAMRGARRERFTHVFRVGSDALSEVTIERQRLWTDRKNEHGPFDIIGDVHGCFDELLRLVSQLGYNVSRQDGRYRVSHPDGRRLIGLGDYGDRGPDTPEVLRFFMHAVADGMALCVKGNHDRKLLRYLGNRDVSDKHGFDLTKAQLTQMASDELAEVRQFLDRATSHLVLDDGKLVVAHAGCKEAMQGRAGQLVSDFCMYGETTGEVDEFGLPVRQNWAADYQGKATVIYGHVPTTEIVWIRNTLCIDTGCVFGGRLTALRWPEKEIVSVPAAKVYYDPIRPLAPTHQAGTLLPEVETLTGKLVITTRFNNRDIVLSPERTSVAFEILARHTVDPRWLITIPPTTATVEASSRRGWLERPEEAFEHYARAGVAKVCVQEKHMGSRALVIACCDDGERFGDASRCGVVISKGGRRFFDTDEEEAIVVNAVRDAMTAAGLWDELRTSWVILDGEILPWSAKAGGLIRDVFAATGSAGNESAQAVQMAASQAAQRGIDCSDHLAASRALELAITAYRHAYRPFVVPYNGPMDLRFAPFHWLAAEHRVFDEESHSWHMDMSKRLADHSSVIHPTRWREVDPSDPSDCRDAIILWESLTQSGQEGFVVKGPHLALLPKGIAPSLKVRGREYLRIIYGPSYDQDDILPQLKRRETGRKRNMARVGTALALESLIRFVERASLASVHESVAACLALANEPMDARL